MQPREHTDGLVNAFRDGRAALRLSTTPRSRCGWARLQAVGWALHAAPCVAGAHSVDLQLRVDAPPGAGGGADPRPRTLRMHDTADMFTLLHQERPGHGGRDAMGRCRNEVTGAAGRARSISHWRWSRRGGAARGELLQKRLAQQ